MNDIIYPIVYSHGVLPIQLKGSLVHASPSFQGFCIRFCHLKSYLFLDQLCKVLYWSLTEFASLKNNNVEAAGSIVLKAQNTKTHKGGGIAIIFESNITFNLYHYISFGFYYILTPSTINTFWQSQNTVGETDQTLEKKSSDYRLKNDEKHSGVKLQSKTDQKRIIWIWS